MLFDVTCRWVQDIYIIPRHSPVSFFVGSLVHPRFSLREPEASFYSTKPKYPLFFLSNISKRSYQYSIFHSWVRRRVSISFVV
jgi:hypothetical protein